MPDTEMSLGGVGGEGRSKWDMQSCSGESAAYSYGAVAHWMFRESTLGRDYRIHRNHGNSQMILAFTNPNLDRWGCKKPRMVPVSPSLFPSWLQTKLRSTSLDPHHELISHIESTARIMATQVTAKPNSFWWVLIQPKLDSPFLKWILL